MMMVQDEGDVPPEPVKKSPSEVPVINTSTSSLDMDYPSEWMKTSLAQVTEKSMKAHDQPTKRPIPTHSWLQPGQVGKEATAEEETKDPKKLLQEFVDRFQHKANPTPKVAMKHEAKHFTMGTPPVTPERSPAGPPGLGTRVFSVISPTVPLRHEEKIIAQNNRAMIIKKNMKCLFGQ